MMQKRDLEQFCKKRVGQTTDLLLSACFQSVSDLKRENEGLKKESRTSFTRFEKNSVAAAGAVSNYLSEYFTPARLYLAFSAEIFDLFHKSGKCRSISRFPQP